MRIGIDATALPPQPVGAGNYIIQLIRALVGSDSPHQWVVFASQFGKELVDLVDSPNLEWSLLKGSATALGRTKRLLWEQIALPRLARELKLDLLHSLHYTMPLLSPCPAVVTFHDMTFFLFPDLHTLLRRFFFPWMVRGSARRAAALIAVSESTRQDALRLLKFPSNKIFTVPNGVNPEFQPVRDAVRLEDCRKKYNLPEEFILTVGTIEPRKNLALLLRAFYGLVFKPAVTPDLSRLMLVVVGKLGWMYDQVFQMVRVLGLGKRVIFTGYLPASDLPLIYNLAKLFVYPSLYEGFGFPPLEAMACGIPVITSAISAMQDYVGEGGLLTPPGDEQALLDAMRNLLSDSSLRQRLTKSGQKQASGFTWERTAQETLKVYQQASTK